MSDGDAPAPAKKGKSGLHARIYPYMTEFAQYANEQDDNKPWIVRDRSTALRNERQGRGRALVRVWIPTSWEYVNILYEGEEVDE